MGKHARWGVWLVALGAAMWGTDALMRQPLIDLGLSSVAIVLAEHIILLAYAIPAVALNWSSIRRLSPVQWGAVVLIAWGASGLATVLFTEAFRYGDPTTVILLQKAQPLFAIALARVALGERMPAAYWPCFGLAMVGAYLIAFSTIEPIWRLPQASVVAAGLALGAALLWGAGTVLGRFMLGDMEFHALTGLRFLLAVPFLWLLAIPTGGVSQAFLGIALAPATVALLALVPGLLGMLVYYRGLSRTPGVARNVG